ncbi:hypothetical protein BJV78DRAFT_1153850 [Lactifluus subvellereus]|nr:hypothetical protein BJV78DRAFT_1153850 [Lactifluus subvellereus]
MSLRLHSLCSELLVEIFSYLPPRDIAACQRSCRRLNDTIIQSQLLQYLLRAGRSGLHDPLLPGYTLPDRIEALERWETSWKTIDIPNSLHFKYLVACKLEGERAFSWTICDDFLIMTRFSDPAGYAYVDLRALQPVGGIDPWTKIMNNSWRGKECRFAFSVEQDLVVTVCWPTSTSPSMFIELEGISFLRGTAHSRVVNAAIPMKGTEAFAVDTVIAGDRTIVNVLSEESQKLFLHSWKDGRVFLLRDAAPERVPPLNYEILSRDMIALVEADGRQWELEICRIVEEPDSGSLSLCTLVRLGLPPLAKGASISSSYFIRRNLHVFSDPASSMAEGRPRRRLPFFSSPGAGVVAIVAGIDAHGTTSYSLFQFVTIAAPIRKLVAFATTAPPQLGFIPWKDWGFRVTVCFKNPIYGDLVATGERLCSFSQGMVSLYDLNTLRAQDAIRKSGMRATMVKHGTKIPRGRMFKKDVVSKLPHIFVRRRMPLCFGAPATCEGGIAWMFLPASV